MLEWAVISATVAPHVKRYVTEKAAKLAAGHVDSAAAKLYKRLMPDKKLQKAVEAFVAAFDKELRSTIENPTLTGSFFPALKIFLTDHDVLEALEKPLDAQTELDWDLLKRRWTYLLDASGHHLIALPQEFDWEELAARYVKSLQKQSLADPELREIAQVLATLQIRENTKDSADAVRRFAGLPKDFDLVRYAKSIQEAYGFLRLGSLDADWAVYEGRVSLEHVYIPQSAKSALPPRDLTRDYLKELRTRGADVSFEEMEVQRQQYEELRSVPILEIVDNSAYNRLVILGDPGLGKSTLLKYLALRWSHQPTRPLALLLELRRTVQESGQIDFLDYVERGAGQALPLPRQELYQYLQENESLVLFDGLDEVVEGRRGTVVLRILSFSREYPKARIIVTSRIHGYHPGSTHPEQFRDAQFKQFTLQDFMREEVDCFITMWNKEAFQQHPDRARYESRLRRALAESPAIRELSTNPLLLTMMAILNRVQDLPRDRVRLYERCAELLLKNWDLEKFEELKERREAQDIKDKLGPEQKMRILELVAAAMQRERSGLAGNIISEEMLKRIIEKQLVELGVQQPWSVADDLIWMLRERNFMLAYLGDRQYAFVHRTFLEYFCAHDLKYRLEKTTTISLEQLASIFATNWPYDEWQEVLCLLSSMIGVEHADKCISALLKERKTSGGEKAILLSARCLMEIREVGSIRRVKEEVQQALFSLAESDIFELPISMAKASVREQAIHELARGWREEARIFEWLRKLAFNDPDQFVRAAAIQEMARGWKESVDIEEWLKERLLKDRDVWVRRAIVQELAHGWRDEPWMLPWLKELAMQAESPQIRLTAVEELAQGSKGNTELTEWLRSWVLQEQHSTVKSLATQAFATAWKDELWVMKWLKELILQKQHPSIRWRAIEELALRWKENPETLVLLKMLARTDLRSDVRQTAMQELERGWPTDPEVIAILREGTKS
jgi:GTPase SAR1 family protein